MLGDIERAGPAGERLTVVGFAIAPVLPGVNEFVPHRLAELLPAEFLVGVPGEPVVAAVRLVLSRSNRTGEWEMEAVYSLVGGGCAGESLDCSPLR